MWLDLNTLEETKETKEKKQKKIGILVMVDEATRCMMVRTVAKEQNLICKRLLNEAGFACMVHLADFLGTNIQHLHTMKWAEERSVEMRISPGQSHTRTNLVERRYQLLRKSLQIS